MRKEKIRKEREEKRENKKEEIKCKRKKITL